MNTLVDADFDAKQEEIKSKVAVLYFTAAWCAPCRALGPIMNTIASEVGDVVEFLKVDIDDNVEIPEKFGIRAVPTIVVLKNGEEANRFVGLTPKAKITEIITNALMEPANDNKV